MPAYKIAKQHLQNVMFYTFECVLSYLNHVKNGKRKICKNLLRSETTLFCCLNVHLFSTAQYLKNIKEEKTPEIKSSKGTEDC